MDNFFKILTNNDLPVHHVTKSAFSQARHKVKHQAFIELTNIMTAHYYDNYKIKKWKGFCLKAIDGTKMFVPKNEATEQYFGTHKNEKGESYVIANVSQIFDCLNHITISALISSECFAEREQLYLQMNSLNKNDLLLLDRGYTAQWLFSLLSQKKINFCCRVDKSNWHIIEQFSRSNDRDMVVVAPPVEHRKFQFEKYNVAMESVTFRLIKIELESGQTEILLTSLTDKRKYRYGIFKELYHKRWPVEEDYKVMKHRVEIENFSGKSVESIFQDFYAKIFSKNLTAIIAEGAQIIVEKNTKKQKRKHIYKVNFVNALAKMKNSVVLLFRRCHIKRILSKLMNLYALSVEAVRYERKHRRPKSARSKRFWIAYKPIS